jgi:hypothetical protein
MNKRANLNPIEAQKRFMTHFDAIWKKSTASRQLELQQKQAEEAAVTAAASEPELEEEHSPETSKAPSNLLLLPGELRNRIFFFVLYDFFFPLSPNGFSLVTATSKAADYIHIIEAPSKQWRRDRIPAPTALARTCKQGRREVISIFYGEAVFNFRSVEAWLSSGCVLPAYRGQKGEGPGVGVFSTEAR